MSWIQTFTGKAFDIENPQPDQIDIVDIAHALSHLCRYNGHTKWFYSVAQHSVLVAETIAERCSDPFVLRSALLHDAAEAYLGDMVRPLKRIPDMRRVYEHYEHLAESVISARFGLLWPWSQEVHDADNAVMLTEQRDLMAEPPRAWAPVSTGTFVPPGYFGWWEPPYAKEQFLLMAAKYGVK